MVITYNPYNWKIIRNRNEEQIRVKQKAVVDLLEDLDDYEFYNYKSVNKIIMDILELQSEINNLWEDLEEEGIFDTRPMYSEFFHD